MYIVRTSARTAFFNEIVKYEGPRITRLCEWEKTVLDEIRFSEQFLKFRYSEKATKFDKIFHLKFDVTE